MLQKTQKIGLVIFAFSGGGKDFTKDYLLNKYADKDVYEIGTGRLLRAEKEAGTAIGKQAAKYMNKGELVPDSIIFYILNEAAQSNSHAYTIFNGVPRREEQIEEFDKITSDYDMYFLYLEVSDEERKLRIEKRNGEENRDDGSEEAQAQRAIEDQKLEEVIKYYQTTCSSRFYKANADGENGAIRAIEEMLEKADILR